jgi:hypothetical protein
VFQFASEHWKSPILGRRRHHFQKIFETRGRILPSNDFQVIGLFLEFKIPWVGVGISLFPVVDISCINCEFKPIMGSQAKKIKLNDQATSSDLEITSITTTRAPNVFFTDSMRRDLLRMYASFATKEENVTEHSKGAAKNLKKSAWISLATQLAKKHPQVTWTSCANQWKQLKQSFSALQRLEKAANASGSGTKQPDETFEQYFTRRESEGRTFLIASQIFFFKYFW